LSRSAAFANTSNPSGVDFAGAATSAAAMAARLPIMSANEDETLLRDAGFSDVSLFYAAFSFRGWLATA
jgi:tRNA (cmo5U34)-methyltransferase